LIGAGFDTAQFLQVIYEASIEVRSAIVFGTAMVILVFIPLFALSGVEGRLFTPLGVAYIVSILASLLVSLTVTPVLSYYLLPQAPATHREKDSPLLRVLKWAASYLVRFSMSYASAVLLLTWVLVGLCAWRLAHTGGRFLPEFDEGSVQVNVTLPPGSSLEASNRLPSSTPVAQMQKSGSTHGEILHFARTGRAELDEHAEPVNTAVSGDRPARASRRSSQTRKTCRRPRAWTSAEQPLAHLISHMPPASPPRSQSRSTATTWKNRAASERINEIEDIPGMPRWWSSRAVTEELHISCGPTAWPSRRQPGLRGEFARRHQGRKSRRSRRPAAFRPGGAAGSHRTDSRTGPVPRRAAHERGQVALGSWRRSGRLAPTRQPRERPPPHRDPRHAGRDPPVRADIKAAS
jgi:HME family heavy-metal exporter